VQLRSWHTDPNAEIFIDRNGARFQYVLDYLRDGKVHLPVFVSKASLLLDLNFFGVPVNGNNIVVNTTDYSFFLKSKMLVKDVIQSWETEIQSWEGKIKSHQKEIAIIKDSIMIMNEFIKQDAAKYTINLRSHSGGSFIDCNKHLEKVGLCVVKEAIDYSGYGGVVLTLKVKE